MFKQNLILLMFFSSIIVTVVVGICPKACDSCINDICVKCDVGNYLESGSCLTCPAQCTTCNNSGVCYNCTEGYYGLSCEKNCISSMCLNNTCSKDSGACLHGCIEGYFLSASLCYPCGANCKTCANFSNNCLECKEGYYGPFCQYPCSRCKDGICTRDRCTYGCGDGFYNRSETCNSCNKDCTSCSLWFDNCHACVDGYFGPTCQFKCSDCSICNQNGSCPKTTLPPPVPAITSISSLPSTPQSAGPTSVASSTHQSYSPTISETSKTTLQPPVPATTSILSLPSTPQSAGPTSVESTTHQSYFLTTRVSNNEERYQQKQPMDNTIKYAVGGGVGGFLVFVMIVCVVFVTKRWSRIKQTNVRINSQLTERDGAQDYTTLEMRTRKEDGHLYSDLDNTNSTATMETMSTMRDSSGQMTQHALPQKQIGDTEPGIYINVT